MVVFFLNLWGRVWVNSLSELLVMDFGSRHDPFQKDINSIFAYVFGTCPVILSCVGLDSSRRVVHTVRIIERWAMEEEHPLRAFAVAWYTDGPAQHCYENGA